MKSNTALSIFTFQEHTLRVIEHNGEPWFVGYEVCEILGIANSRDAISRLSDNQKDDVGITDTIGRTQQTKIISEGGLYKLTFRSHKPEAEAFTDMIVDEVLPAIRKTGAYNPSGQIDTTQERIKQLEHTVNDLKHQIQNLSALAALPAPRVTPSHVDEERIIGVMKRVNKPLTPAQVHGCYLKRVSLQDVYVVLETGAARGTFFKECTPHAPRGKYRLK